MSGGPQVVLSSEAIGRAALCLGALSSALIALGFAVTRRAVFGPFLAAVLPVMVVLGFFTFLRLFEIGLEDVEHLQAMQRIRRYYRSLVPDGAQYFPDLTDEEDMVRDVQRYEASSMSAGRQLLLTAASDRPWVMDQFEIGPRRSDLNRGRAAEL